MSDSLLKVGGKDLDGLARSFTIGQNGELKTSGSPQKNLFLGYRPEPFESGYTGVYGIFGVQIEQATTRSLIPAQRYDNGNFASNGIIYYIDGVSTSIINLISLNLITGETKKIQLAQQPNGKREATIIDMGTNIAVVNNQGVGELFDAATLTKIKDITWDVLAYEDSGKWLASNPNYIYNTQIRESSGVTHVLTSHRVTTYDTDGIELSNIKLSEVLDDLTAFVRTIISFSATATQFFISGVFEGNAENKTSMIVVIDRATKLVTQKIKVGDSSIGALLPVAIANNSSGLITIGRNTGAMYKWTDTAGVWSKDAEPFLTLPEITSANATSMFVTNNNDLMAIRTERTVNLVDVKTGSLLWSVQLTAKSSSSGIWFDGMGHLCFADDKGVVYVVNQFMQVQGYGVEL